MKRTSRLSVMAAPVLVLMGCTGTAGEAPRRVSVEMFGFEYQPASLVVHPGDTVVWVNRDAVPHTVTATDRRWDSAEIAASGSWMWIAEGAGEVAYECVYHPTMRATVRVE